MKAPGGYKTKIDMFLLNIMRFVLGFFWIYWILFQYILVFSVTYWIYYILRSSAYIWKGTIQEENSVYL